MVSLKFDANLLFKLLCSLFIDDSAFTHDISSTKNIDAKQKKF